MVNKPQPPAWLGDEQQQQWLELNDEFERIAFERDEKNKQFSDLPNKKFFDGAKIQRIAKLDDSWVLEERERDDLVDDSSDFYRATKNYFTKQTLPNCGFPREDPVQPSCKGVKECLSVCADDDDCSGILSVGQGMNVMPVKKTVADLRDCDSKQHIVTVFHKPPAHKPVQDKLGFDLEMLKKGCKFPAEKISPLRFGEKAKDIGGLLTQCQSEDDCAGLLHIRGKTSGDQKVVMIERDTVVLKDCKPDDSLAFFHLP